MTAYVKEHPRVLSSKPALAVAMKDIALPPVQMEIEQMADLGAPPEDKAKVATIISGMEGALRKAEAKPGLLVSFSEGPFIQPGKLAGQYGFKDCASPF